MNLTDTWLLTRKNLIGIVITLIPLAILAGGLWLTQAASGSKNSLHFRLRGGEGGIRTLGTGVSPYNGLANRRIRPLCHLSGVRFSLA